MPYRATSQLAPAEFIRRLQMLHFIPPERSADPVLVAEALNVFEVRPLPEGKEQWTAEDAARLLD
jgi:hypothetical protein